MNTKDIILLVHITLFRCACIYLGKKGDCTISMKDNDLMDMVMGKLGPQKVSVSKTFSDTKVGFT